MASHIEIWPTTKLIPFGRNPRTHSEEQVAQIAASIREFGFNAPILVDSAAGILAGHGRLLAARKLRLAEVPVIVLDHLSAAQKRAYVIADNRLAEQSAWDDDLLRTQLEELKNEDFDLASVGFSDDELRILLEAAGPAEPAAAADDTILEAPIHPVTQPGDLWLIGKHRLMCGDCRDADAVARLLNGEKANVAITSPPYAQQREYDTSSGFRPLRAAEYCGWFRAVSENVGSILAPDGSYFLNIKEHSEDGERSLYVKDLVLTHKRQWGWRFVDEFCWRNTANGVPGKWPNRLKNAWEPVFHFSRSRQIKFRPLNAGHESDDVVVYAPGNATAPSGSGLLGCGAGKKVGIAWPSNVVEVKAEGGQSSHSAPFPRPPLVEFFLKAFSDPGDRAFDPFAGSATMIAAAHVLGRTGYGIEISPAYCEVGLARIAHLTGLEPVLADTGQTLSAVAAERRNR